ncbi:MAG TPA: 50S ribosomal protein L4 [Chloroflexota bacterium]|nr:50S ribosomal protein L4 [Chloroflexota bacterium]
MPSVDIKNARGESVGTLDLDERVFGIEPNRAVLHQAVVTQLANQRKGTHDTKTRGEVAGGGKKPWRQKGTGRARQGSTRSPHWRGGGIVFGPHPRSYHRSLPRKMRRLAMRSALSAKVRDSALTVVDVLSVPTGKTREMVELLGVLGLKKGALMVLHEREDLLLRSSANVPKVRAVTIEGMNLLDILNFPTLILTRDSVAAITERLLDDASAVGAEREAKDA